MLRGIRKAWRCNTLICLGICQAVPLWDRYTPHGKKTNDVHSWGADVLWSQNNGINTQLHPNICRNALFWGTHFGMAFWKALKFSEVTRLDCHQPHRAQYRTKTSCFIQLNDWIKFGEFPYYHFQWGWRCSSEASWKKRESRTPPVVKLDAVCINIFGKPYLFVPFSILKKEHPTTSICVSKRHGMAHTSNVVTMYLT